MASDKIIYLIRHGETEFNRQRIVQGSGVDSSLNDIGRAQAKAFFAAYQHIPFDAVITSALKRTHETAKHFLGSGINWKISADINEISWGTHEGRVGTPEMMQQYEEMIAQWQLGNFDASLPQAESAAQLAERCQRFINYLRIRPEKTILICSHGRAIRCLMTIFEQQPLQMMEMQEHSNTGLFVIRQVNGQFIVEKKNNIEHLQDLSVLQ
jgi:phosphoserine phosphatase